MSDTTPVIGVLALQGDVREHLVALAAADAVARPVRRPEELAEEARQALSRTRESVDTGPCTG